MITTVQIERERLVKRNALRQKVGNLSSDIRNTGCAFDKVSLRGFVRLMVVVIAYSSSKRKSNKSRFYPLFICDDRITRSASSFFKSHIFTVLSGISDRKSMHASGFHKHFSQLN